MMTPRTTLTKGGRVWRLYSGLWDTQEEARNRPYAHVLDAYREVSGDTRPSEEIDRNAARKVVVCWIAGAWFREVQKKTVPGKCRDQLADAIEEAAETPAPPDDELPGITQEEFALGLFSRGFTNTDAILNRIYKAFPHTKANRKTVNHYRWRARQEGIIE